MALREECPAHFYYLCRALRKTRHIQPFVLGALLSGCLWACSEEKEPARRLHSEEDLSGLVITTMPGTYYDHKYSGREDVTLFRTSSDVDCVQALKKGMADVYVTAEIAYPPKMQERLQISLAFLGEEAFDVAFAVRKGNQELQDQMNRFLSESKADGTLDAIIAYWTRGGAPVPLPPAAPKPGATSFRCVTGTHMEPICFLGAGGEWQGMDADILRRFAIWSGRPFEMKLQELASAMLALNTGQCDVVSACLFITDERKKSVDSPFPIMPATPVILWPIREAPSRWGWENA